MNMLDHKLTDYHFVCEGHFLGDTELIACSAKIADGETLPCKIGVVSYLKKHPFFHVDVYQPEFPRKYEIPIGECFTFVILNDDICVLCKSAVPTGEYDTVILHGFNKGERDWIHDKILKAQSTEFKQDERVLECEYSFSDMMTIRDGLVNGDREVIKLLRGMNLPPMLPQPMTENRGYEVVTQSPSQSTAVVAEDGRYEVVTQDPSQSTAVVVEPDAKDEVDALMSHSTTATSDYENDVIDAVYREITDTRENEVPYPTILYVGYPANYVSSQKISVGDSVIILSPVYRYSVKNVFIDESNSVKQYIEKLGGVYYEDGSCLTTGEILDQIKDKFNDAICVEKSCRLVNFKASKCIVDSAMNVMFDRTLSDLHPIVVDSLIGAEEIDDVYYLDNNFNVPYIVPGCFIMKASQGRHNTVVSTHGKYGAVCSGIEEDIWRVFTTITDLYKVREKQKRKIRKERFALAKACALFAEDIGMKWEPQYSILPITAILNFCISVSLSTKAVELFVRVLANLGTVIPAVINKQGDITDLKSCLKFLDDTLKDTEENYTAESLIGVELYLFKFSENIESVISIIIADSKLSHQLLFELMLSLEYVDPVIERVLSLHNPEIAESEQLKTIYKLI